jgi:septal ring factor EnvC (AmiA/AmiB activator)
MSLDSSLIALILVVVLWVVFILERQRRVARQDEMAEKLGQLERKVSDLKDRLNDLESKLTQLEVEVSNIR